MHGGNPSLHTSAQRERRIPVDDARRLDTYLRRLAVGRWAPVTADWIRAGICTGIRPCEWAGADLDRDTRELTVQTAKARGAARSRILDLSTLSETDFSTVARHVQLARSHATQGTYAAYQTACADTVYRACQRLWPRGDHHYCLYSARHQASANLKSELPPAEVSAALGHEVTGTAQQHYGRRTSAWPSAVRPGVVQADIASLALVRETEFRPTRARSNEVDDNIGRNQSLLTPSF